MQFFKKLFKKNPWQIVKFVPTTETESPIKEESVKSVEKVSDKQVLDSAEAKQLAMINNQKALSMLLLQTMVRVYNKNRKKFTFEKGSFNGWNPSHYAGMYTPDGDLVFKVLQTVHMPHTYYFEIPNGDTYATFGLYPNDGTFFCNQHYNYAEYMYDLIECAWRHRELLALREMNINPDVKDNSVWPAYRMKVFPYLEQFLTKAK